MSSNHALRRSWSGRRPSRRISTTWLVALAGMLLVFAASIGTVPAPARAQPPIEVAADTSRVEPGIVRIDTTLPLQQAIGTGTGVVLSPDGIVLTNNHVVRGAATITATNVGNGQRYSADVIGYDRKNDLAVLQLRGAAELPVAPTADSAQVRVGDAVTSVGFPGGGGLTRAPGRVRALDQSIVANDDLTGSSEQLGGLIDFAADVRAGDSGGPLVDADGNVVGIVTAATENYKMTSLGGFAIPLDQALPISDAIRSGAAPGSVHVGPTAIIGIGVGAGQRTATGVIVEGVLRGAPAEQAGLRGGDVITAIDDTAVGDATALVDVLDQHHPGDTVTVSYLDQARQPRTVPVTLTEGPPD